MFNQGDYRMAKAQQERLRAQAEKQDGRARQPNIIVAFVRRLVGRRDTARQVQPNPKPAEAKV